MATQIQLRRDTSANWTTNNPILAEGEIGIETDGLGTPTILKKIGNGFNDWVTLPYESTGGGGSVESVTGDGVGGTSTDVVMTFPTPIEIGALQSGDNVSELTNDAGYLTENKKTIVDFPTAQTTGFTVPDGSDRKWIDCDFSTDQNVTVTTTSIIEEGEVVYLEQIGSGKITLIGVTPDGSGSVSSIGQGDVICVVKKPLSLKKI